MWRPSEKAYLGVGSSRVIGWTKLLKDPLKSPEFGGRRFTFPDTKWNWLNVPSEEVEQHLNSEITAYKANHWYYVSGTYDFAKSFFCRCNMSEKAASSHATSTATRI